MRHALMPIAASVILLAGCQTKPDGPVVRSHPIKTHVYTAGYARQTPTVRDACMPDKLKAVLLSIRNQTGRTPILTSGYRPNSGRKGSLHRHCMAADIRIPGIPESAVVAAALKAPGTGGIGTYCDGIVHVDIGPRRRWKDC